MKEKVILASVMAGIAALYLVYMFSGRIASTLDYAITSGRWVVTVDGAPQNPGWQSSGYATYAVQWEGDSVSSCFWALNGKHIAQRYADKMNELHLGRFWRQEMSTEKGNQIWEQITNDAHNGEW